MPINLPRYVSYFLIGTVCMIGISIALALLLELDMPPGLTTILPAMIAAHFEGVKQARENRKLIGGTAAWGAALAMTAVAFIFTACFLVVQLAIPGVASALTEVSRGFLYGLMVFVTLLVFLTNRVFFHNGMKTELAKLERGEEDT